MSIVVAASPTPEGHAAVRRGAQVARRLACPLVLVEIPGTGRVEPGEAGWSRGLTPYAEKADVVQVSSEGDVTESILHAVREHKADLIVMGLRQRTAAGKLLLGTRAQRILIDASCDVLCVKIEGDAPPGESPWEWPTDVAAL